jgi:hypothetical protein
MTGAPADTPAPQKVRAPCAELVLLDRGVHRRARIKAVPPDHSAVLGMNAVFCAAAEFGEACKSFPLLFIHAGEADAATGQAPITPVCLLGLQNGQNLFVDAGTGRWTGGYLPAFLRRHPFALVKTTQADGAPAVAVDTRFPGFVAGEEDEADEADEAGAVEGERLFDDAGEPAPKLQSVLQFLHDFDLAADQTRPIGAHLQSLGLLKEMRAQGPLPGGQGFSVDGFLVVDEARLRELPDAAVLALHRNGLLALIHAHLVSLDNIRHLVARRSAQLSA